MLICILSAGCSINDNEQLTLDDEQDIKTSFIDTLTIESSVVAIKPVSTNSPDYLLFGNCDNEDLGKIATKCYTQLGVANASLNSKSIYDSMVLHLEIGYRYGEYNKPQTVAVFELEDGILNRNYYQNEELNIKPQRLNEQTNFLAAPLDSPRINIKMKDLLGEEFFRMIRSDASEFSSQEKFVSYFKGLAIMAVDESKAVFGINPSSVKSRLSIYYHQEESKTRSSIDFYMTDRRQFNHIDNDLSGTPLNNINLQKEIPSAILNNKIYINTGSPVLTKIKIPYLDKLVEKLGPISINKAELEIRNLKDNNDYAPPIASFILLETNSNNEFLYYVDEDEDPNADLNDTRDSLVKAVQVNDPTRILEYGNNLIVGYNEDLNNYTAPLTHFVQAIIDKRRKNEGLLIYPVGRGSIVNSLIAGDHEHADKKMKLRIFYTQLQTDNP